MKLKDTAFLEALAGIVGADHVRGPDAVEPRYLDDHTGGAPGRPSGLVRPSTVRQLAQLLAFCRGSGQAVVVQGGRTGLARAALPRDGELILSMERMAQIEAVDADAGVMQVGAGCTLEAAQDAARDAGWRLAVDIGSRGSCTIGGMIATNAGGTQVLRYGMMREQILGLEAVLADGTIISSLGSMLKDNAGYDLKQLFIGSEGTLGVVTRAVLRLRAPATGCQTALCKITDYRGAVHLLARLECALPGQLIGYELMWDDFFRAACLHTGQSDPFPGAEGLVALVEIESRDGEALTGALAESIGEGAVKDVLVAQSERDRQRFWRFRHAIADMFGPGAIVEPFDVSAPITLIGDLVANVKARLACELPGGDAVFFGHIADNNLHIALELAEELQRPQAEAIIYDAVRDVGGSVSAEHGIGYLKRAWLRHSRSADEVALMRRIRSAMDPEEILNPGRIF